MIFASSRVCGPFSLRLLLPARWSVFISEVPSAFLEGAVQVIRENLASQQQHGCTQSKGASALSWSCWSRVAFLWCFRSLVSEGRLKPPGGGYGFQQHPASPWGWPLLTDTASSGGNPALGRGHGEGEIKPVMERPSDGPLHRREMFLCLRIWLGLFLVSSETSLKDLCVSDCCCLCFFSSAQFSILCWRRLSSKLLVVCQHFLSYTVFIYSLCSYTGLYNQHVNSMECL